MWFAIVGKRTVHGTTALTRSPSANPSPSKTSTWSSPARIASRSSAFAPVSRCSIQPVSLTWPPPAG